MSIQPPLGSRAALPAKHIREILATGCIDPRPAGDCGVCLYCVILDSDTVDSAVEPRETVDHFSKDVIVEYQVGLEALSSVLPTMDAILNEAYHPLEVGGRPVLSHREWHFQGW